MEPDFSGYATKAGLRCADGRTITPEAFKHQDKMRVPLVWQHGHKDITNVLGHAMLEARLDGMYCQGFFNSSPPGLQAREAVEHGDITKMSIFAGELAERNKIVSHGTIKEVSLCLAGKNPGAEIDYVAIRHADGSEEDLDDEAIIKTGLDIELKHSEEDEDDEEVVEHADDDPTAQDVYDAMTDDQKTVVNYLIGEALTALVETGVSHADIEGTGENGTITHKDQYDALSDQQREAVDALIASAVTEANLAHSDQEGNEMGNHNVFEGQNAGKASKTLSHSDFETIVSDAQKPGNTFRDALKGFLEHAQDYGIEDIDVLFPDAKMDGNGITYLSRRMDWVQNVLSGTKHSPFSRIKSLSADITADEARAKGYVKGSLKKNEIINMLKRVTTPTTIYKKQKLDRDDIVDITDLDVVAWLKGEMRIMLDEEIARAILIGDGREADDEDKINEDHVRPIAFDIDMYNTTVTLPTDTNGNSVVGDALVDAVVNAMTLYKGTGTPTLYTTLSVLTAFMLAKDMMGRRLYPTKAELAAAMMVADVVPCEVMEDEEDIVGVLVNLVDYTVGADAGGNISMFDDFDIDYNQQKYLIETRISGALTRPKSAVTLKRVSTRVVTPTSPTFVNGTGVVTVPSQPGTVYNNADTGQQLASGAQAPLTVGQTLNIEAHPAAGYGFVHDSDREFTFTRV